MKRPYAKMTNSVSSGFTLLEVLIAVTILAFIAVFTARMVQQGVSARKKIHQQLERTVGINAALDLMTHDIQQAFHYRDVNVELYNAAQKARQKAAQAAGPKPPPGGGAPPGGGTPPPVDPSTPPPVDPANPTDPNKYKLKEEKRFSQFLGEAEKLNFTSLDNFRGSKNLHESDQAEVGYYLENCTGRGSKTSSQCLWRRLSPYIDEEIKEGGKSTPLLENVKSLKFRYLGAKQEKWSDKWDMVNGEEIMKDKFPVAVEISLTVLDMKFTPPKDLAMTVVAPLYFSNNKPDLPEVAPNAPPGK